MRQFEYPDTPATNMAREILELQRDNRDMYHRLVNYKLEAAKYKAYFFGKRSLATRLENQIHENRDYLVGEFDGFCYASWRANAVFRTLYTMYTSSIITEEEYEFCNI